MALRNSVTLLASAAMAVSRAAAYAVVDADALADLASFAAPVVNAAVVSTPSELPPSEPAASTVPTITVSAARVPASTVPASTAGGMADGCVHFQVVHSTNTQHFGKRAAELSLSNRSDVAYYAKLNFGTPGQAQYVQLDTGSFELWVNPSCSGLSSSDKTFCEAVGTYDPSASSTFSSLNSGKTLRYGIGSANITYAKDSIALPGTSTVLSQVQFGVAASSVDEFSGILGIGYGLNLTTRYPNFVDELADQGVTKVKAFSLALGSKSETEGVIVFGGVDTSKFAGKLARLPITPAQFSPDGVPRYWVNMTSMSLTATAGGQPKAYSNSAIQVFLDSGSTLTLLPTALVSAIAADFSATGPSTDGFYMVDCALVNAPGSLNFAFAGVTISVKFSELIRQSGTQCMLGLQASSSFALLGDTFLRSAYVVIDQTANDVWMAPYTNCGSTPAALLAASSLATLTGACSQTGNADANVDAVSSLEVSSASASSAPASAAKPTGTAAANLTGATASSSAAAAAAATASSSASNASSASLVKSSGGGLVCTLLVAAMLNWL